MQQFLMRARTLALFLTIYSEQSGENVAQQEQVECVHYDQFHWVKSLCLPLSPGIYLCDACVPGTDSSIHPQILSRNCSVRPEPLF